MSNNMGLINYGTVSIISSKYFTWYARLLKYYKFSFILSPKQP